MHRICSLVAPLALATGFAFADDDVRVVSQQDLLEAMHGVEGYELTATPNGARLQADVLLHLIRQAEVADPLRRPLLVGHEEWFQAFLQRTDLSADEAPIYVQRPYEVGQDLLVDYRREHVVEEVVSGPEPRTVANVRIFWPRARGKPKKFSYDDLHSDPTLRVTQKRRIHYRLVDYEDRRWFAEVGGLHGRPTSGGLGLLFKVIGEARVLESRSAVAEDGVRVVRGRAKKLFVARGGIVTVRPNGQATLGVPEDRPDLRDLAVRLNEPLEIRFRPLDPSGWVVSPARTRAELQR